MDGPFDSHPFDNIHFSPLLVRPKPNGKHRVIVDMSWPRGGGVNACVPDDKLDCLHIKLAYPTIDNLVAQISKIGPHALLYKVDLQRAYRNLRVDPLDYPALGLKWDEKIYVDVALAFGFKGGASFCQLCTDAVTYLMSTQNYWVMSYLDDIIGVDVPVKAHKAYYSMLNLLEQLGLPVNRDKISAPVLKLVCLGIQVDTRTGVLSIPQEKLCKIKNLCDQWQNKTFTTRNQLQKLLGHLIYISRCIKPARLFVNRMLQLLRSIPSNNTKNLDLGFFRDLRWFTTFLDNFNGSVEMHLTGVAPHYNVHMDACLKGMGAICNNMVYYTPICASLQKLCHITQLEVTNALIVLRTWGLTFKNKYVIIWCDNKAVVEAFASYRIRDPFLAACIRTI